MRENFLGERLSDREVAHLDGYVAVGDILDVISEETAKAREDIF